MTDRQGRLCRPLNEAPLAGDSGLDDLTNSGLSPLRVNLDWIQRIWRLVYIGALANRGVELKLARGELFEPARARRARKFFHALGTIFAPLWAYFLNFSGERGTSPPPERLSQGNFPLPSPSSTPILTNHIVLHAYFRLKTSALLELLRLHHRYFFMGKKYMHVQGTKIGVLCTHIGDLGTKPEQKSWSGFGFEGGIIIIRYLFLLCNPKHDPLNCGYTVWFWV